MQFEECVQRFHAYFTADANACVALGVNQRLRELPDPSLAAARRRVIAGRELLAMFRQCQREQLDFDTELDLDLAVQALEYDVFWHELRFNGKLQLEQLPDAADGISDGIFLLFANDPRPSTERLADITARLELVPEYLAVFLARLDTPVARWRAMDLAKARELPAFFATLYQWAQAEVYPELSRLSKAIVQAEQALSVYCRALQQLPVTANFAIGSAAASELIRLRGIDVPLTGLSAMAREFLAVNMAEVEELRQQLLTKYRLPTNWTAAQLQDYLNKRYQIDPGDAEFNGILASYRREQERIIRFIEARELFPLSSDQTMKIIRTPGFMVPSIPAGAMMSPPPFRSGVRQSLIYLTLDAELLAEHTALSIPVMLIHEGIPGHHLQLASAAAHNSIIRRHVSAMDQAEGWTTMLEDYFLDLGYMEELTLEARFIAKRDIARLGARVAIDLYFMTGNSDYLAVGVPLSAGDNDPFVNAGCLLKAVTGFTDGRLQGELNWYSQSRGYPLSYLAGNQLVWQLKHDVSRAQQGRLEGHGLDRVFHQTYLAAGAMPLSFLRRVFKHEGLLND